jgi:hypothetical protein
MGWRRTATQIATPVTGLGSAGWSWTPDCEGQWLTVSRLPSDGDLYERARQPGSYYCTQHACQICGAKALFAQKRQEQAGVAESLC